MKMKELSAVLKKKAVKCKYQFWYFIRDDDLRVNTLDTQKPPVFKVIKLLLMRLNAI